MQIFRWNIWKIRQNFLSLQQNEAGKSFPFLLLYGEKRRSTKSIKVLSRQKSEGMVGCQNALRRDAHTPSRCSWILM